MATPEQQLMGMMSPQQARLLDDQLREQQIQQQAGGGMFSGAVAATLRGNDMLGNAFRGRQAGANELKNIQDRQELEEQKTKETNVRARGVAELNNIIKAKIAAKEISAEKGRSLLVQAAQGIREPLEIIKELTESSDWRSAGGNKLFRPDTGEVKDTSTAEGFEPPTLEDVKDLTEEHTTESVQAFLKTVTKDNPTGDSSLLVRLGEANYSATGTKIYAGILEAKEVAKRKGTKYQNLANEIRANSEAMTSGVYGTLTEVLKNVLGTQDYITAIKTGVEDVRAQIGISNLPPGVASDADVALVMRGTLPANASPKVLAQWISGMSKVEKAIAAQESDKLRYLDNNGGNIQGYETYHTKKVNDETLEYVKTYQPRLVEDYQLAIVNQDTTMIQHIEEFMQTRYGKSMRELLEGAK